MGILWMSFGIWIVAGKGQDKVETVERVVYRSGSSEESHVKSAMEAQNVRVKLSAAEERVKSLVSKLDAVSEDASRARLEIHSTLLEAWNIVDLLGKDRCGDAVLEVRRMVSLEGWRVFLTEDFANEHCTPNRLGRSSNRQKKEPRAWKWISRGSKQMLQSLKTRRAN